MKPWRAGRRVVAAAVVIVLVTGVLCGLLWWLQQYAKQATLLHLGRPGWIWVLLICPSVYWAAMRSAVSAPFWQRTLMSILRCLLILCLCMGLAEPSLQRQSDGRCSVLLLDVSPSVSSEAIEQAIGWARHYEQRAMKSDSVHYVQFDETAREVKDMAYFARPPKRSQSASDYGRALRFGAGLCEVETERHMVLLGDGLDTHRGLLPAAQRLREIGYRIDVVSSRVPPPADVGVRRLSPPSQIEMGRVFRLGVELTATRPTSVRLEFELDGVANSRESGRSLDLPAGNSHIEFESQINHAGSATLRVSAIAALDGIAENNRVSATVDVKGPPRVLYVDGLRTTNVPIVSALTAQRFSVESIRPERFPTDHASLRDYAAVILSNIRRDQLGILAEQSLERYVRGAGGVVLFAGGSTSFAAGGWSGSRIERLLPVTLTLPERQPSADLALALVIDRSGSMSGLPLEMAKSACAASVETLRSNDLVEVIAFDAKPVRYFAMQRARARAALANDLSRILAGGDTELFPALDMAYQDLLGADAPRKHVILLTDGQSPKAGLTEIVQNMVAESITLTIVGLGPDVDTELLRHLAERGGGRYHAASDPNALPRIFVREAESLTRLNEQALPFEVRVRRSAQFLSGIDMRRAPLLRGCARTQPKPPPAEVILESDRAEPILARVQRGDGWVLAWTSDLGDVWATEWVRWREYGRFFAQLIRQHQPKPQELTQPIQVELQGNLLRIFVDASNADGSFDNDRVIAAEVKGPDPSTITQLVLPLAAPGLYRVEHELVGIGDYQVHATQRRFDAEGRLQTLSESDAQVSLAYPLEFEQLLPNLSVLEQVANIGGGMLEPTVEAAASQVRHPRPESRPMRIGWLTTSLLLFLVDLLVRRLRV